MADPRPTPYIASDTLFPGLIWALSAKVGEAAAVLDPDAIAEALANPQDGRWTWIHIDLVDRRAHDWLVRDCPVPDGVRQVLEGQDSALTLGHDAGFVYGVIADHRRDFEAEPAGSSSNLGRLHFAVNDRLLITGRRHALAATRDARALLEKRGDASSAFDVFETVVSAFCRATAARLAEAGRQLDSIEDQLMADRLRDDRRELKFVRRLAVSLHRPIAGLVTLFEEEDRTDWALSDAAHAALRRLSGKLEKLDREVVMINDRARLLQEEIAAELADESNRSLRALTVMSAFMLPGTLVVGAFGMNLSGMPFAKSAAGFLFAAIVGVVATLAFFWILKRAGANLRLD